METHVVIMAGGIGSRFWPMSTQEYPKQFIDVAAVRSRPFQRLPYAATAHSLLL